MTAEDNKTIFRRLVEEVINPGKLNRMDELNDPAVMSAVVSVAY